MLQKDLLRHPFSLFIQYHGVGFPVNRVPLHSYRIRGIGTKCAATSPSSAMLFWKSFIYPEKLVCVRIGLRHNTGRNWDAAYCDL